LILEDDYIFVTGDPAAVDLTFVEFRANRFYFSLSAPILSQNITVQSAQVSGYTGGDCSSISGFGGLQSLATFTAGNTFINAGRATGTWSTSVTNYEKGSQIKINGTLLTAGQTITLESGCVITARITNPGCSPYTN
jgi:hypothetical protein